LNFAHFARAMRKLTNVSANVA